ncbi:hypothetical protein G3G77_004717 [Salmonella enterica]|nr:hypothetical protein [Salmonella enterica]EEH5466491.1 hypothetical protein [Salmonella enterica]EEH7555976.1 hypothetical protein [Salmonella enterica]EEO5640126.1 hypothetical protein [Salmonella enterica]EEQ0204235.1 hypothetical protein [Salmonella enterica]
MDTYEKFSLGYEQLFQEAEEQIKKYDLNNIHELTQAREFLAFWHRLALKGQIGTVDPKFDERIDADWEHLNALIHERGAV